MRYEREVASIIFGQRVSQIDEKLSSISLSMNALCEKRAGHYRSFSRFSKYTSRFKKVLREVLEMNAFQMNFINEGIDGEFDQQ